MHPITETLVVDPAVLRRAAVRCSGAASACGGTADVVATALLTSTDVGPDGAELRAAAARFAARVARTLEVATAALRADAERLRSCAQDYVSSDTRAALRLTRVGAAGEHGSTPR